MCNRCSLLIFTHQGIKEACKTISTVLTYNMEQTIFKIEYAICWMSLLCDYDNMHIKEVIKHAYFVIYNYVFQDIFNNIKE